MLDNLALLMLATVSGVIGLVALMAAAASFYCFLEERYADAQRNMTVALISAIASIVIWELVR